MQNLKQILLKKAKIIGQLKYPPRNNRQAILRYLKNIKKQQKQNQSNEQQILLSLQSIKYQTKQHLQKVYFLSFTLMKSLSKKYQFMPQQNDIYPNIVQMHYKFYIKQGALLRAQQIRNAFRKKLYQKDFFLNTLLVWLYDWGKRKLQKFLNKNISSIQKDLLTDKLQSPKKILQSYQKIQKTTPLNEILFEGTFMNISYSDKSQKIQKKDEFKIKINGNNTLFGQQSENMQISPFENNKVEEQEEILLINEESTRMQTSFEPQKSEDLGARGLLLKNRSKSFNRDYLDKSVNLSTNINKEIFYGAYSKQMNQLYRNMNCICDIDLYYLKTFKKQKQQKRQQLINNRMQELIELVIKSMPNIKKSIDNYAKDYSKSCPNQIKQFHSYQSKKLQEEIINKKLSQSKKKNDSKQQQSKSKQKSFVYQKMKSQQNININEFSQRFNKITSKYRLGQRNKSLNDAYIRKQTQQKVQMQVKLPIVYNPQHFINLADSQAQKAIAIHQKFQKFMLNGIRPNKGLARYKHLNKQRQRKNSDISEQIDGNQYGSQIQFHKQHEYEVANIRKILKKRQKQRMFINKTPTPQNYKQQQTMQKIMLHIKVMQTQKQNQIKQEKKADKFDVFLNNFKNSSSFYLKTNSKSINLPSFKNSENDFKSPFRQYRDDFLPKIS